MMFQNDCFNTNTNHKTCNKILQKNNLSFFNSHVPFSPWNLDSSLFCTVSPCLLWSVRAVIRRDYTYSPLSWRITSTACPAWLRSNLIGLQYCPWKVASKDHPVLRLAVFLKHLNGRSLFIPLNIKVIWALKDLSGGILQGLHSLWGIMWAFY